MERVDLSLEQFFLQAISLCQRQFCMLLHLEAPDLSGQGKAAVLGHDLVCWDIYSSNINSQMY